MSINKSAQTKIKELITKGKDYDIRFDRSRLEWACDCPAFKYRRRHRIKYCKHILEIQERNLKRRNNGLAKQRS